MSAHCHTNYVSTVEQRPLQLAAIESLNVPKDERKRKAANASSRSPLTDLTNIHPRKQHQNRYLQKPQDEHIDELTNEPEKPAKQQRRDRPCPQSVDSVTQTLSSPIYATCCLSTSAPVATTPSTQPLPRERDIRMIDRPSLGDTEQHKGLTAWDNLHVDIQLQIFAYLADPRGVSAASKVCNSWRSHVLSRSARHQAYRFDEDTLIYNERCTFGQIAPDYIKTKQEGITPHMRTILVDWLIEVCDSFRLQQSTLFLAVNTFDRYMSVFRVPRNQLQLVGATCLFLSAKYEEVYPPDISDLVFISDGSCSRESVLSLEVHILNVLAFRMTVATSHAFVTKYFATLRRTLAQLQPEGLLAQTFFQLCNYLLELLLLDYQCSTTFKPSLLAASVLCVALHMLALPACTQTLEMFTYHSIRDEQMKVCVDILRKLFLAAQATLDDEPDSQKPRAAQERYKTPARYRVALLRMPTSPPTPTLPLASFPLHPTIQYI